MTDGDDTGSAERRRVRLDRPRGPGLPGGVLAPDGSWWTSGRVLVIGLVISVLALYGGLSLAFRQWRAGYEARAEFGRRVVAPAVDPLAEILPADDRGAVSPAAWRDAVSQTHAMLVALTGSNVLDGPRLRALADEVTARVARTRPETAREDLAALWDLAAGGAGPVILSHYPRPSILRPASTR
jgi:hypothetical protein